MGTALFVMFGVGHEVSQIGGGAGIRLKKSQCLVAAMSIRITKVS